MIPDVLPDKAWVLGAGGKEGVFLHKFSYIGPLVLYIFRPFPYNMEEYKILSHVLFSSFLSKCRFHLGSIEIKNVEKWRTDLERAKGLENKCGYV